MSERAFASLTPANALARLAFSDVYGVLTSGRQNNQPDDALRRMAVEPQQTFDSEIFRLRVETRKRALRNAYATDGESSESLTEPDTDTEQAYQELGMIWKGRYLLRLKPLPSVPFMGWAAGKGPLESTPIDLLLCTRPFAKLHGINLRNPHARFNFALTNRSFYIIGCSRSPSTQLTVNGETAIQRPYHLNQHRMKIQLEKFEYDFQWTEFAANDAFKEERHRYVTRTLGGPEFVVIDAPTPLPNRRTMGKWTLGEALGAGGRGRVFFASDSSGDVAAIKVLERTFRNYHSVDEEIETLQNVTDLVDQSDDSERLLRVVEVIYSNDEKFSSKMIFDNVAIVLRPMMPRTFVDLMSIRSKGEPRGMTMETASAFRDALRGVKVMHDAGWVHRDLKPANIGLFSTPLPSVLLDLGTSRHISAGGSLRPEPGTAGTLGYLAPEFELQDYDHSIDIWAMAIILYELTYGHHPWKLALNPWRDGKDNEKLRSPFQKKYEDAMMKMKMDCDRAYKSPADGYIHLGSLFVEMVRYPWARSNNARRPDIDEVLLHRAWGPLLPASSQVKRRRLQDGLEDGGV